MRQKKVPLRTCVGCGLIRTKRELARIIVENGHALLDGSGRKQGRGAYVCRVSSEIERVQQGLSRAEDRVVTANPECLEMAKVSHALERSFKQKIESVEIDYGEEKRRNEK